MALRGYAGTIAEMIGTEDAATLALVERVMRDDCPTLDHLTRGEFAGLVAYALAGCAEMAEAGFLAFYCRANLLAVPVIVPVPVTP